MQYCNCQQGYSKVHLPRDYITCKKNSKSPATQLVPLILGIVLGAGALAVAGALVWYYKGIYLMHAHSKRKGPPGIICPCHLPVAYLAELCC